MPDEQAPIAASDSWRPRSWPTREELLASRRRGPLAAVLHGLHGLLLLWTLASLALWAGLSLLDSLLPAGLPLPWSIVDDVTVGASGRTYVYSASWKRIYCFAPDGSRCGEAKLLDGKARLRLASTDSGALIARKASTTCVAQEPNIGTWSCRTIPKDQESACFVVGHPEAAPGSAEEKIAPGGEERWTVGVPDDARIFCPEPRTATSQAAILLGELIRTGPEHRVRLSPLAARGSVETADGRFLYSFEMPRYLYWLNFPFPVVVPPLVLILWDILDRRKQERRFRKGLEARQKERSRSSEPSPGP